METREEIGVDWKVRAIRGATTAEANTVGAIREAVTELLDELETWNHIDPEEMISVTFSVTRDLDAIFPAAIARSRPGWNNVPLLDVQQMHVQGSLERCIRFLIHVNVPASHPKFHHPYLRGAKNLRPDWGFAPASPAPPVVQSHHL
jgi:chorismate mutase